VTLWQGLTSIQRQAQELILGPNLAAKPRLLSLNSVALYTWYRPLFLHMLLASICRIIGQEQQSTFKFLPSPRMEESEIPCDKIATIKKKKHYSQTNDPIFLKL
jgi:hypothetical protein